MIYLLSHVERFAGYYAGKFNLKAHPSGAGTANESLEHEPRSLTVQISSPPLPVNIVIQAEEDNIGGLVTAVNSISSNSKIQSHFYFVVPNETVLHLQ